MIKVDCTLFRPVIQHSTRPRSNFPLPAALSKAEILPLGKGIVDNVAEFGDEDGPCGYSFDYCGAIP